MLKIERLRTPDLDQARAMFSLLAAVFENDTAPLSAPYLTRLLARDDFWAFAAFEHQQLVGGLTAFTLPLTRLESHEIFLYDIAVLPSHQRRGIGRQLLSTLRGQAAADGIQTLWVPVDNEDSHALDFYRATGGSPSPVTIFTY